MKTKHKRLIITGCSILLGLFSAYMFLLAPGISPLSISGQNSIIFYPFMIVSLPAVFLSRAINSVCHSNSEAYLSLFLSQFIICLVLGVIISFVAYPPWKRKEPEPTQD